MNTQNIGKRIKQIRKDHRLTQTEFGEQIGVKGNTITGYENGTRQPSDAVISIICLIFGVDQTWLRTGEGEHMYVSDASTISPLQNLFNEFDCNNLEMKFLQGYFGLNRKERDAFCELLSRMFPDAIEKIVGPDPIAHPSEFKEALPLVGDTIPEVDIEAEVESYRRELELQEKAVEESLALDGQSATG